MLRFLKQFLYGVFYLLILVGVGFGFNRLFLVPAPSCFDGILNQLEIEVDCGGECISCELKDLELDFSRPTAWTLGESTSSLMVEATNPSANYGVRRFEYTFDIFNQSDFRVRSVRGETSLYPSESKPIVVSGLEIDRRQIGRVEFTPGSIEFTLAGELVPRPEIELTDTELVEEDRGVAVSGKVANPTAGSFDALRVVAVAYGATGAISAVSSVLIPELPPFSERDFRVILPVGRYSRFETQLEIPLR